MLKMMLVVILESGGIKGAYPEAVSCFTKGGVGVVGCWIVHPISLDFKV